MGEDSAFSHITDSFAIFWKFLISKRHPNCTTISIVTEVLLYCVDFSYWWSFSGGGSATNGATQSSTLVLAMPEARFSLNWPHWAASVIELSCLSVWMSVCLCHRVHF